MVSALLIASLFQDLNDGEYGSLENIENMAVSDGVYATFAEGGAGSFYTDAVVQLSYGGNLIGTNYGQDNSINGPTDTEDVVAVYGGQNDTMGAALTAEIVNDPSFGVTIQLRGGGAVLRHSVRLSGFSPNMPTGKAITGVEVRCKWLSTVNGDPSEGATEAIRVDSVTLTLYYE